MSQLQKRLGFIENAKLTKENVSSNFDALS